LRIFNKADRYLNDVAGEYIEARMNGYLKTLNNLEIGQNLESLENDDKER
jgi:hypothetical protein